MQAINKLILGTVQFGLNYGVNNTSGKPDRQAVEEILNTAWAAGIRCLDTAEAYGDAHQVIGQFHQKYPERVFDIITKLPHDFDGDLNGKIQSYLKDLKVNQLHGLLFHSYQSYSDNKKLIGLLNQIKNHNIVKYIGVSVYTNSQMLDVIKDDSIDIIQLPFNLFDNTNLRGAIIKQAKDKGKIIHTRSAFLQGLFFSSLQKENNAINALHNELSNLQQLSKHFKIPVQKMALNYCVQQNYIDNVLIGVDNLDQLNQNIADVGYALPNELIDEINGINVQNVDLLNPSLWKQ